MIRLINNSAASVVVIIAAIVGLCIVPCTVSRIAFSAVILAVIVSLAFSRLRKLRMKRRDKRMAEFKRWGIGMIKV